MVFIRYRPRNGIGTTADAALRAVACWCIVSAVACATAHPSRTPAASARGHRAEPSSGFLVLTDTNAVELRSLSDAAARQLVPHADFVLHDPSLELLWYIEQAQLYVVDLRTPEMRSILLARDLDQVESLAVRKGTHAISPHDTCGEPFAVLHWTQEPSLVSEEGDRIDLDGAEWLTSQQDRTLRPPNPHRRFVDHKVSLPADLLQCEDEETCGSSVPFGDQGLELVLVVDTADGDCGTRACLLHDPRTGRFASPPSPKEWGAPAQVTPGACGPYHWNPTQSAYLMGPWLCARNEPCRQLEGQALGWVDPGQTVGE